MKYLTTISHKLVRLINKKIDNYVGIIDLEGMIIAHSNQQVIGEYSKVITEMNNHNQNIIIVEEIQSDIGRLPGVYLPVFVNSKLRCVLLVQYGTQTRDELLQICDLLVEICRLTISEHLSAHYLNYKTYDRTNFLIDWLKDEYKNQRELFSSRAREHAIKSESGVTVAMLRIYKIAFNKGLFNQLSEMLMRMEFLTIIDEHDFVIIFNSTSNAVLKRDIEKLQHALEDVAPKYLLAVGSVQRDCLKIQESYREAKIMLDTYYGLSSNVLFYEDCILDICFSKANSHYKEALIERVFGNCSPNEIADFSSLINMYFRHNGSIALMADETFVHKNTIQYRIARLKSKTDFDIRNLSDSMTLYVAAFWASKSFSLIPQNKNKED